MRQSRFADRSGAHGFPAPLLQYLCVQIRNLCVEPSDFVPNPLVGRREFPIRKNWLSHFVAFAPSAPIGREEIQ